MRIVKEIPLGNFKATIFSWNGKYLIKFESGSYEQTYKISEMDLLAGDEDIVKLLSDQEFMGIVNERFNAMKKDFAAAIGKVM